MKTPRDWVTRPLSQFVSLQRGFDLPTHARVPGSVPVLSSGGVNGSHNEAKVDGDNFVIGRVTNIGRPTWSSVPFWPLNTTLFVKDFLGNFPKFCFYWFLATDLSGFDSGSVQPTLNRNYIANIPVAIPSFVEQRRIAEVLGALDDKIESNLRTISLSESLVLAHFSSLFNSGPVSAGTALSDLMDVNPRYSLKRENLAIKVSMQDIPSDSPVINTHAVMPVGAGSRFSNGDVLFARISPCLENGKTAIVDFLSSSEVGFGSTEFIVLSPRGEISTTWIYALARDPNFREACRQAMSGSSGRQRLSADFFSRYTIATPKESDLVAFNEATMPLLTLMGARRDENQRLAPLRDALLPELMSGRMRVDEAGYLVSEALDEEVADV